MMRIWLATDQGWTQMFEAVLANMPDTLARGARSVRNLFIVSGCPLKVGQGKVMELYRPLR